MARRTVFRPDDQEDFGRVAERVAAGNMALLGRAEGPAERLERTRLRNAIATGALLTSGRHLQHGDPLQAGRNMEVFTNCATAIASFAKFYLLLNGAGVGRAYDDALMAVDWTRAPRLYFRLDSTHPDFPDLAAACGEPPALLLATAPDNAVMHRIADSREGWAAAAELVESMAFAGAAEAAVALDFSAKGRALCSPSSKSRSSCWTSATSSRAATACARSWLARRPKSDKGRWLIGLSRSVSADKATAASGIAGSPARRHGMTVPPLPH